MFGLKEDTSGSPFESAVTYGSLSSACTRDQTGAQGCSGQPRSRLRQLEAAHCLSAGAWPMEQPPLEGWAAGTGSSGRGRPRQGSG